MHVHLVYDAIQTSHPLLSPFPPVLNLSHHQSFLLSQFFTSGGQGIGASASARVLWLNIQDWIFIPLGWTGWISLKFKGLSSVLSNTTVQKHQFFGAQPSSQSNSHIHTWLLGKPSIALTRWTFVGKVISLFFNMLSRWVIAFPPRTKCLIISWLQSPSAVILEPKKIKSLTVSIFPPSICHEMKVTNIQSETTECFFYLPILAISPSTSHFLITQCLSDFKINTTKTKYMHTICKKETWVNSNNIGNKYHCFSILKP